MLALKKYLKWVATAAVVSTLGFSMVGCEDPDLDDIAKGQECLDKARSAADAEACRKYAKGSSQEAKILKCSVEFMVGGLDSTKMRAAFKKFNDDGTAEQDREAELMFLLAADSTTQAATTFSACKATNVGGLIYLASLSQVGTILAAVAANGPAAVDACIANDPNCDPAAIGQAAVAMSDSYCTGDNEDTEVCEEINAAVAAGATSEEIGDALLAQMNQ